MVKKVYENYYRYIVLFVSIFAISVFLPFLAKACAIPADFFSITENGQRITDNRVAISFEENGITKYSLCFNGECYSNPGDYQTFYLLKDSIKVEDYMATPNDYNSAIENPKFQNYLKEEVSKAKYSHKIEKDEMYHPGCGTERHFKLDIVRGILSQENQKYQTSPIKTENDAWFYIIGTAALVLLVGLIILLTLILKRKLAKSAEGDDIVAGSNKDK